MQDERKRGCAERRTPSAVGQLSMMLSCASIALSWSSRHWIVGPAEPNARCVFCAPDPQRGAAPRVPRALAVAKCGHHL